MTMFSLVKIFLRVNELFLGEETLVDWFNESSEKQSNWLIYVNNVDITNQQVV